MQEEERRRFKRIDLHAPVRYQIRGEADFSNTVSDNISAGGLSFSSHKFIPPSTKVMLEMNLLARMLNPIGVVSWCQPLPHSDRNRLGIEFLEMEPSEKRYLSDYIDIKTV